MGWDGILPPMGGKSRILLAFTIPLLLGGNQWPGLRIRVFWSDPVCKARLDPDLVFKIRSDPDSGFKIWSDPLSG